MKAILENDFLCNISCEQLNDFIDSMYEQVFATDEFICRENLLGNHLYIIAGKSLC